MSYLRLEIYRKSPYYNKKEKYLHRECYEDYKGMLCPVCRQVYEGRLQESISKTFQGLMNYYLERLQARQERSKVFATTISPIARVMMEDMQTSFLKFKMRQFLEMIIVSFND